ncbi:MAG: low molecular weight phosphatase family protein [Pseudomonadota bacterium]
MPGAVLFVCSMNAIRSPMAAGLLHYYAGHRIYVASAGVRAGEPDGFVIAAMDELGIDVSQHAPQTIDELGDTSFDLIISLSPEAHHQALELTRTMAVDVEYWPSIDPSVAQGSRDQMLEAYRASRDALATRILARFDIAGSPNI